MNKNIEHYLFHKENFLDDQFCQDSVDKLNSLDWKKHRWYNSRTGSLRGNSDNEPEIPAGDLKWNENINNFILQKLHSTILEYIESFKFEWFDGWNGYTRIKFLRYFPDQTMQNHCDHIRHMFDGKIRGIPILSIIGLLNDDYEGGELIMFEDKKIETKEGDLLIFPSNFLYPHKIAPVTKGVRYSYTSWVW